MAALPCTYIFQSTSVATKMGNRQNLYHHSKKRLTQMNLLHVQCYDGTKILIFHDFVQFCQADGNVKMLYITYPNIW